MDGSATYPHKHTLPASDDAPSFCQIYPSLLQSCWQQLQQLQQQQQLVALSHSSASTHSSMLTWRSCQVVLKVCCRHLSFSFDSDGAHADVSALRHG